MSVRVTANRLRVSANGRRTTDVRGILLTAVTRPIFDGYPGIDVGRALIKTDAPCPMTHIRATFRADFISHCRPFPLLLVLVSSEIVIRLRRPSFSRIRRNIELTHASILFIRSENKVEINFPPILLSQYLCLLLLSEIGGSNFRVSNIGKDFWMTGLTRRAAGENIYMTNPNHGAPIRSAWLGSASRKSSPWGKRRRSGGNISTRQAAPIFRS